MQILKEINVCQSPRLAPRCLLCLIKFLGKLTSKPPSARLTTNLESGFLSVAADEQSNQNLISQVAGGPWFGSPFIDII